MRLRDGQWAAIEVKTGNKQTDETENLLALKSRVTKDKMSETLFQSFS